MDVPNKFVLRNNPQKNILSGRPRTTWRRFVFGETENTVSQLRTQLRKNLYE